MKETRKDFLISNLKPVSSGLIEIARQAPREELKLTQAFYDKEVGIGLEKGVLRVGVSKLEQRLHKIQNQSSGYVANHKSATNSNRNVRLDPTGGTNFM